MKPKKNCTFIDSARTLTATHRQIRVSYTTASLCTVNQGRV